MVKRNYFKIIAFILVFSLSKLAFGQTDFSCVSDHGKSLAGLIGSWEVVTKDRTSPGNYEYNEGRAEISDGIKGCSIHESFRGAFKENPYAREVFISASEDGEYEIAAVDSEHGGFSIYQGEQKGEAIEVIWYRNKELRRLQSKYVLTIADSDHFELSSFLSQDYGKTWALTHERKYTRTGR